MTDVSFPIQKQLYLAHGVRHVVEIWFADSDILNTIMLLNSKPEVVLKVNKTSLLSHGSAYFTEIW